MAARTCVITSTSGLARINLRSNYDLKKERMFATRKLLTIQVDETDKFPRRCCVSWWAPNEVRRWAKPRRREVRKDPNFLRSVVRGGGRGIPSQRASQLDPNINICHHMFMKLTYIYTSRENPKFSMVRWSSSSHALTWLPSGRHLSWVSNMSSRVFSLYGYRIVSSK